MDKCINKVAVVTGASAGIGAKIVETFVKHGMGVVGGARNVEKIQVIHCVRYVLRSYVYR